MFLTELSESAFFSSLLGGALSLLFVSPLQAQQFGAQETILPDAGAERLTVGDVDGDELDDVIAVLASDGSVVWFQNLGDGAFSDSQTIVSGSSMGGVERMRLGDLDGDGLNDVVLASNSEVSWFENPGEDGSWNQSNITNSINDIRGVRTKDMNDDDEVDVLSASAEDDKVAWYKNEGGGEFGSQRIISQPWWAQDVHPADLDGDGDPDVISVSEFETPEVQWNENRLDETEDFGSSQPVSGDQADPGTALSADVDSDGDQDIITRSSRSGKLNAAWHENRLDSGEGFSTNAILQSSDEVGQVYTRDIDLDGEEDLFMGVSSATGIAWYPNAEEGGFGSRQTIDETSSGEFRIAPGDLNGDGSPDIVAITTDDQKIVWYENLSQPTNPLSVIIEGTRINTQTLPSRDNTPKDAIPYPPDEKTLNDRVEVLRYSADRVVLRSRVRLKNSFNGSVEDISVEGTLDGQVMQTVIRDSVDTDGDGEIDALPFDHYGTGDNTKYADVLLVSSQNLESGAENLSFEVTATTASGSESQASGEVSLYYAEREGDGRPFDPQTDGYRFRNLTSLSFNEVATLLAGYGVVGGYTALYQQLKSYQGRCFGMAGTAGVYFDEPAKKVFSGETYQQPESDTETRQQIADYHLAQDWPTIDTQIESSNLPSEYSSAKNILREERATPMIGIEYDLGNETSRHAILGTKLTVLQNRDEAVFEVHDSNNPGTTYDLSYDIAEDEIDPSLYTTNVTAFATINVDDVPFFPEGDWYRSIIAYLVDNVGEVFASTFTPSDKSARKTSASPKSDGESVYVVVENDQGQRAGFLADGTKVNEINGAVVKEIVTDSSAGEKATYVAVPPGNTYTASIATSAEGDIRFEHAVPIDSSTAEVNYAESVAFTDESAGTYDEDTKEIELDEDGDGTTDKTISTESSTLPVELTSFNARAEGQSAAVLTWQTASEENNAGFEVQHQPSSDERWKTLSFVESKASGGTTSEANTYRYAAEDLSVGTHQFRLKQVDLDGSSRVHGPVSVDVQMQEALKLTAPAPNPVSSTATLSFAVKEKTQATVAVYDMLGRRAATLFEGIPTPGESNRLRLNASSFPSGSYIIRLRADGQTKSQQVTVVR